MRRPDRAPLVPPLGPSERSRFRLAALPLAAGAVVFACKSEPPAPIDAASSTASATAAPVASAERSPSTSTLEAAPDRPKREVAGAAHVLIAYSGAEGAAKTVTRSKEQAKKRAQEALEKLKTKDVPFETIVKEYSDDAISKAANGAVGNFERNAMPQAFSDATFSLLVGSVSEVVETPRGFHIIKRTK